VDKPELANLTPDMLEEYIFPGTDAASVVIPDGQKPSSEVKEVLDRSGFSRWYPVTGGHRVKVPWHFAKGRESLFEREKKGWDHEHCDYCNEHVNIGQRSWTIPAEGGVWLICQSCRARVPGGAD
jgi:hypothetical protein